VRRNMRLMRTLPSDEGSRTVGFEPLGTVTGANRKATATSMKNGKTPTTVSQQPARYRRGRSIEGAAPPSGRPRGHDPICDVDTLERQDAGKSLRLISASCPAPALSALSRGRAPP
jgi:hypothetical protein